MLYFSGHIVGAVFADIDEGRGSVRELHAPVLDDPRLACLFVAVREAAIHPEGDPAFEERLLTLFGRLFIVMQTPEALPANPLSKVRERIDDAPAHSHALAELAALAGLSRYQTVRGFAPNDGAHSRTLMSCSAGWTSRGA